MDALTRKPQHTGEFVWVEPLAKFLAREVWSRPSHELPAAPTKLPSLDDYDRGFK